MVGRLLFPLATEFAACGRGMRCCLIAVVQTSTYRVRRQLRWLSRASLRCRRVHSCVLVLGNAFQVADHRNGEMWKKLCVRMSHRSGRVSNTLATDLPGFEKLTAQAIARNSKLRIPAEAERGEEEKTPDNSERPGAESSGGFRCE